jgi:hypothetical protein
MTQVSTTRPAMSSYLLDTALEKKQRQAATVEGIIEDLEPFEA